MNAANIMTTGVFTLTQKHMVGDAVKMFFEKKVRQVPIVDEENKVLGVITPRFLMRAVLPGYIREGYLKDVKFAPELKEFGRNIEVLENKPISEFLKTYVPTAPDYASVTPETSVMEVATIFINTEKFVDRILVVDNQGRLLGMISPVDVFKTLWKKTEK